MRYPTDSNGLAIPPFELAFNPPTQEDFLYRRVSRHHHYWTRQQYGRSAIHHTFRNLTDHVTPMIVNEHQGLHDKYSPSKMPHVGLMIDVLDDYIAMNGVIHVVREKATNDVQEIELARWNQIRQTYRSER